MKRMNRREFAKLAGGVALVPLATALAAPRTKTEASPQKPAGPIKAEPKPKLTPEQQEKVQRAIERRNKLLAGMRGRVLPYSLEPAFVFRVWRPTPRARKAK